MSGGNVALPNEPEKVQLTHQMLADLDTGPEPATPPAPDTTKEPALA
ncbi:hypothetical protein [Streptomyces sp. NBC_00091]|nr:hypothetical protein [Streptomyces sp. NBC_00091]MCX5376838.1 hypothetical protein [Streptomyces sp. NBC_00091]